MANCFLFCVKTILIDCICYGTCSRCLKSWRTGPKKVGVKNTITGPEVAAAVGVVCLLCPALDVLLPLLGQWSCSVFFFDWLCGGGGGCLLGEIWIDWGRGGGEGRNRECDTCLRATGARSLPLLRNQGGGALVYFPTSTFTCFFPSWWIQKVVQVKCRNFSANVGYRGVFKISICLPSLDTCVRFLRCPYSRHLTAGFQNMRGCARTGSPML